MKIYKIQKEDVKGFMPKLLINNVFDNFEVRQVEIHSFAKFEINSNLTKSEDDILTWEILKPYVYNIIKGNILPKNIKIVFCLRKDIMSNLSESFSACFLNMNYDNGEVFFTTGTSKKTFNLNKSDDLLFEEMVGNFFNKNGIFAIDVDKI